MNKLEKHTNWNKMKINAIMTLKSQFRQEAML